MTVEATQEAEPTGPEILDVNGLLDAADPDEAVEEEAGPEEVEAKTAAKGAKPEAKPAKSAAAAVEVDDLSDLLADGVTFTPETVKKGAARVVAQAKAAQELTAKAHKVWGTAEKHANKTKRDREQLQSDRRTFGAQAQQLSAAFNALRTGDAKTALEGLRQLSGRDPVAWLEELNVHIASDGKRKPKSKDVQELEERLERFERAERERKEAEETAREKQRAMAFVERRKGELAELATGSAEECPNVAEFMEENPALVVESLVELITRAAKRGRKVGDLDAVRMLEEQLQRQSELSQRAQQRKKGTADSGSERGTGSPRQQAKPGTAQAPTVKGKSLSASALTAPAVTRQLTEEELDDDSADFLPPALLRFSRGEF